MNTPQQGWQYLKVFQNQNTESYGKSASGYLRKRSEIGIPRSKMPIEAILAFPKCEM